MRMGTGDSKKIALLTLGCKLNYAESATYERGFRAAGYRVVPWNEAADIYLVNTCSVTATSDAKSRNLIRKVHRINPDARIVVTGCSAELRGRELEKLPGVWRVFGCREKSRVVADTLAGERAARPAFAESAPPVFGAYSCGGRTRSFLKVQDGCDNRCAYCTVPLARGGSRNIPIRTCVAQAEEIAARGVREIVLTGVNTGDFGKTTGETFLQLLQALNAVEGIQRYRISSIEPNLLTDDIIDWIASGTKFQPHFHIPLQSGCDEILRAMGRRYDTALFASRIARIRQAMEGDGKPPVFFGIDVMAGLPGESEAQFAQTLAFLTRIRPAYIHAFPYSRRPGTVAASLPGQVDEGEKKRRVAALEDLCRRLHADFVASCRGMRMDVLFESTVRGGKMEGYTGNYIRVVRDHDPALVGKLTEMEI
ncbi:MAG: tRNA (N(6)-L-threonylcarbamoyladenosine(37)-C(2))-methylthiotransferase MtaB [Bacteroidales bacterium]|nr:tRNA (N(6)-L-threonylcarbamoyladenosine(37)-C(2))-methylthiotransferase MtaB [Bacteroidales bacterium]